LQQAIARKRDLKGSYKAKLSLEKLIVEHERKSLHLNILHKKLKKIKSDLNDLGSEIYEKSGTYHLCIPVSTMPPQANTNQGSSNSRTHLEFMVKEMVWMQEDFEREHKKKTFDAKKNVRMCRKELVERRLKKEKLLKDQKMELRRKANTMSKMVGLFWKSVDKIVRHNHSVLFDRKC
jgi:hypothetical protein